jgi:cytoskeleton protein RodZ
MKRTGNILKTARETQRVSINEVSMATKISPRMLNAIESGDVEALPAKTFLRGFVQSYASFLKLNVESLMETFHQEMGTTLPKVILTEEVPVEEKDAKKAPPLLQETRAFSRALAGAAIVVLILLIVGVKNLIDKYEREAEVSPPEGIQGIQAAPGAVDGSTQKVVAQPTEGKAAAKMPETPAMVEATSAEATTPTPNPIAAVPETPIPTLAPAAKPEPAPTVAETPAVKPVAPTVVEAQTAPVVAPKPNPPIAAAPVDTSNVKNEIILEALDSVDVEFRVGTGELRKITLKPDQIHTIKALGPVILDLSDGGAVNVIHNGRDRGVPGDLGKPKKIKIQ